MRKKEVPMATQDSPNLYERLGGVYSIATVVDDLIDRVMADQRLNANPLVDDAHHKVPPAGFKYLVTEMPCWAAGGPQKYTGKDMERPNRLGPGLDGTPAAQNKAARLLFANGRSCRRQVGGGTAPEALAFKFGLQITLEADRPKAAGSDAGDAAP